MRNIESSKPQIPQRVMPHLFNTPRTPTTTRDTLRLRSKKQRDSSQGWPTVSRLSSILFEIPSLYSSVPVRYRQTYSWEFSTYMMGSTSDSTQIMFSLALFLHTCSLLTFNFYTLYVRERFQQKWIWKARSNRSTASSCSHVFIRNHHHVAHSLKGGKGKKHKFNGRKSKVLGRRRGGWIEVQLLDGPTIKWMGCCGSSFE